VATDLAAENQKDARAKWKAFQPGFVWGEQITGAIIRAGNLRYRLLAESITSQRERKATVATARSLFCSVHFSSDHTLF
jgi:hypothetical protein